MSGHELFIDDLASDVSLSFERWQVDEALGHEALGLRDLKIEASPYLGDLGPENITPLELVVQFGERTIIGEFFFDDCGDVLRLVVGCYYENI